MSFHFYLYRAAEGLPPLNKWEKLHAQSLGKVPELRQKMDGLFGGLRWDTQQNAWNGVGDDALGRYIDIWLSPDVDEDVHFIVMNKAPPTAMRRVLEALNLNYVAAPEAGDLVDVYAYEDNDLYYAKKTR